MEATTKPAEVKQPKAGSVSNKMVDGNVVVTVHGEGGGEVTLLVDKVSAACRARFMHFGMATRLGNRAAIEKDDDGKPATAATKLTRIAAAVDHYNTGTDQWELRAAPAGPKLPDYGLILQAIMLHAGCDLDKANALVASTQAKRGLERDAAFRLWEGTKAIAIAMTTIRAERAAGTQVDVDSLMEEAETEPE